MSEEPAEVEETGRPASNRIAFLLCALAASVALVVALFVYPGWLRHSAKTAPVVQDFSPLPMRVAPTAAVPRTKPSPLKAQPAATAAPSSPSAEEPVAEDQSKPSDLPEAATTETGVQAPAPLIYQKDPEYPESASQAGVKGPVKLVATIGKDGKVKSVEVISGHPLLRNAAADAVRQWIYTPTLLNGSPVETQTEILVDFR